MQFSWVHCFGPFSCTGAPSAMEATGSSRNAWQGSETPPSSRETQQCTVLGRVSTVVRRAEALSFSSQLQCIQPSLFVSFVNRLGINNGHTLRVMVSGFLCYVIIQVLLIAEAIFSRVSAVHRCVARHQQKRSGQPMMELMLTAGVPSRS